MSSERTEKATPRRRQKARQQGDVVLSREATAACAMLAGVVALGMAAPHWVSLWSGTMTQMLASAMPGVWEKEGAMRQAFALRHLLAISLSPLLLLFGASATGALVAGVAQSGGLRFHAQSLQPKFSRLNPGTSLRQIFSFQGGARLLKSLLPAALLVVLVVKQVQKQMSLPPMSVEHLTRVFSSTYTLLFDSASILAAWSALDYLVQWRSWESRLRMSKQEMREEVKESEGSPQVRSRIRGLQRQFRRRKLRGDIQKATVVITNPTHYAIALSFDFETMEAPRVLAKGRNLLAEQIKSEARWAGVPIVENPPLARSLYRSVEEGQSIPVDLYAAVAAILAWLYRKQVEERIQQERAAAQQIKEKTK